MTNRKVILYIATSVDGFIARENGDIDWLSNVQEGSEDYGYEQFYDRVDTVVMGRKTYEQVLTFGDFPYKGKECYVFSSSKRNKNQDVQFVCENAADFINGVKKKEGKDIWLVGGAKLIESFMIYDLIDEYIISVTPIILGKGIALFSGKVSSHLELVDSKKYTSGLVQIHYKAK